MDAGPRGRRPVVCASAPAPRVAPVSVRLAHGGALRRLRPRGLDPRPGRYAIRVREPEYARDPCPGRQPVFAVGDRDRSGLGRRGRTRGFPHRVDRWTGLRAAESQGPRAARRDRDLPRPRRRPPGAPPGVDGPRRHLRPARRGDPILSPFPYPARRPGAGHPDNRRGRGRYTLCM